MDASIVLLSSPLAPDATCYAAALAQFLAVPLLQVRLPEESAAEAGLRPAPAPLPVPRQALLLVLARPASAPLAAIVPPVLAASSLPLLVVPTPTTARLPPRRIALAASGKPFVLEQSRRLLHTLVLTQPTQLTVLHAQVPRGPYSAADARHAVQACGLALHHLAIDGWAAPALEPATGILAGVQQVAADLLIVPMWCRRGQKPAFGHGTVARLLDQCPVPVLLLPVAAPHESQPAA